MRIVEETPESQFAVEVERRHQLVLQNFGAGWLRGTCTGRNYLKRKKFFFTVSLNKAIILRAK